MAEQPLNTAIPVRFSEEDEAALKEMSQQSGMPVAAIIRTATRYCVPRFASGEINPFEDPAPQPAAEVGVSK